MNETLSKLILQLPNYFCPERAEGIVVLAGLELADATPDYWTLNINDRQCEVSHSQAVNPQLVLIAASADLSDVLTGKMDMTHAFMRGKIRLKGKIKLAMKLLDLFDIPDEFQSIVDAG